MAEKERVNENGATEKVASVPVTKSGASQVVVPPRHSRNWVIGIVAGVVALYILIMIAGFLIVRVMRDGGDNQNVERTGMSRQFNGMQSRVNGDQTFRETSTTSDGLTSTSTTTTYTQTQGVVTAVNPDTIVVAGGGKTQTIKTNSSTTYAQDKKPVVNDTVVVVGTKDGDTITATQISVYN